MRQPVPITPPAPPSTASIKGLEGVATARELFWQNLMRVMLTSLSVLSASRRKRRSLPEGEQRDQGRQGDQTTKDQAERGDQPPGDLFDGRLAIVTSLGQRVPIGAVYPLFACGIPTSDGDKSLSMAVECTVFQVH